MCKHYRIRYSEFLQWHPHDRHLAVAYEIREAEHCPDCGMHPDVFDPERGGHPDAMEMRPVHCRGCEIRAYGDKRWERERDEHRKGTALRMRPTAPVETEADGG